MAPLLRFFIPLSQNNLRLTDRIMPISPPAIKSGPNQMRKYRVIGLVALLVLFALVVPSTRRAEQAEDEKAAMADGRPVLGGLKDAPAGTDNDLHVHDLARFAVEEHNKKANALLQFEKVVKVKQQVVAGTMHHLTIQAKDGDVKKVYEAKVWEKPWENFKELHEFKPAEDGASA